MSHYCICPKCKERFNRDKELTVKVSSNRYGHASCFPEITEFVVAESPKPKTKKLKPEDEEKEKIFQFLKDRFGDTYSQRKVTLQINKYIKEYRYTYSGIYKALVYFYEIKKNPVDKANGGIGIVPWCYDDAYNYYYMLWQAQQINKDKVIQDYSPQVVEIHIPEPQRPTKKINKFSFLDEEVNS